MTAHNGELAVPLESRPEASTAVTSRQQQTCTTKILCLDSSMERAHGLSAMSSVHSHLLEEGSILAAAMPPASQSKAPARAHIIKSLQFVFAAALGVAVATSPGLGFTADQVAAQHCLGLVLFVAVCWGLEPIPSYVTALFVPFLGVLLQVMRVPEQDTESLVPANAAAQIASAVAGSSRIIATGQPLSAEAASLVLSASFFDPVIFLFISGFTMAAAMDKHGIAPRLAIMLLTRAGSRPSRILLAVIALGLLLSMWLSNVAAAVLLTAVIRPVLRELPSESQWPKMVLLGIAFSCNLGGMTSPIASPQNVIAIRSLQSVGQQFSFLDWCMFAVPFVLFTALIGWVLLRKSFKTGLPEGICYKFSSSDLPAWSWRQTLVSCVVVVTVAFWCVFDSVKDTFGNLGIVGLFPLLVFHSTKILSLGEFNTMPWNVLVLMGGGLALGNAVESSGLLTILADRIQGLLAGHGIFPLYLVFNAFTAIIANILSSTVCAVIMLPVVAKIGLQLGHARMLVMSVAIMTSGAMGLPVSSFPNANSASLNDITGAAYLKTQDYARTGFPMALVVFVLLSTVGYGSFMLLGW